jgi:hypothetical protein
MRRRLGLVERNAMVKMRPVDWAEYHLRHGWVRFKDALWLNVEVDKNFFPADAARRLMSGKLPKGVMITCEGRRDGVGMQALARISGLNFAHAFGATYVDTPFEWLGHCDRDMADWVNAWESMFNFGQGEIEVSREGLKVIDYLDYFRGREKLTANTVLRFQQCFWLGRKNPDSFLGVTPRLREKYGRTKAQAGPRPVAVAVHVRRGDVTAGRTSNRYTGNDVILRSVRDLQSAAREQGVVCELHLHSQGEAKDFERFADLGCSLHLNSDALWTMRALIESDVLMMSKSSFSYVAALINGGIKLYEPSANGCVSGWIARGADGSFDRAELARRLAVFRMKTEFARGAA